MIEFFIGLFIGSSISKKHSPKGGVIFLQPIGNHSSDPFEEQDENKERPLNLPKPSKPGKEPGTSHE